MFRKAKIFQTLILMVFLSTAVYFLYDSYDMQFASSSVLGSSVEIDAIVNEDIEAFNQKYEMMPS